MDWAALYLQSKTQSGREDLLAVEEDVVPYLRSQLTHFMEEGNVISYSQFWERILLLRNLCISDNQYVRCILEENIVDALLLLCRFISLSTSSSSTFENTSELSSLLDEEGMYSFIAVYPDDFVKKVVRAVAQLLANMVGCSASAKQIVVERYIMQRHEDRHRGSLADLIAAATTRKDQIALQAIWMVFLKTTLSAPGDGGISLTEACASAACCSMFKQLLMSLHSHELRQQEVWTEASLEGGSAEGCQIFCLRLLSSHLQHLKSFFLALCSNSSSSTTEDTRSGVSLEQVLFLFVLISAIEQDSDTKTVLLQPANLVPFGDFLSTVAQLLASSLSFISANQAVIGSERDIFVEFQSTVAADFTVVATHLMGSALCIYEEIRSKKIRDAATESTLRFISNLKADVGVALIPVLAERILLHRDPVTKRTFDPKKKPCLADENEDKGVLWIREMVRRALQLLSLFVIGSPEAQVTLLGTPGLLGSLLQHCATDFENPLAREWALLTVRNLCEENDVARQRIEDLKPQQVVRLTGESSDPNGEKSEADLLQEEAFRKAGLTVTLNPSTGKLTVERQEDTTQDSEK